MKKNFHARFLGGVSGLTACTYPVGKHTFVKRHKHLLRCLVLGFIIAVVLSLAYLLFGAWDFLGWSPEPLWARIVFFPGVAIGQLCWEHFTHAEIICRVIGLLTMGIVGSAIGAAMHVVIHRRQNGHIGNETGSA